MMNIPVPDPAAMTPTSASRRQLILAIAIALPLLALPGTAALAQSANEASPDQVRLFRAAQLDDDKTVKAVLARGLDPNVREAERGETGLIVAMRYDANKVMRALLASPATRLEETSMNGTTALTMAAFKRNKPAVEALLAAGAQVNRDGWTPLHFAATAGDLEVMALLVQHKASINAQSPTGFTALMLAAREGQEDAVAWLLRQGADATLKDRAYQIDAAEFARRADKPWIAKTIDKHLAKP